MISSAQLNSLAPPHTRPHDVIAYWTCVLDRTHEILHAYVHTPRAHNVVAAHTTDTCGLKPRDCSLSSPPSPNQNRMLHTLRVRYLRDEVYTLVGPILISINPYKWIDDLYSETRMLKYKGNGSRTAGLPPHVFTLAVSLKLIRSRRVCLPRTSVPSHNLRSGVVVSLRHTPAATPRCLVTLRNSVYCLAWSSELFYKPPYVHRPFNAS